MRHIIPSLIGGAIVTLALSACGGKTKSETRSADTIALAACPTFSASNAMRHIQAQCDFGPRVTGSEASRLCGDYIAAQFRQYGATVEEQTAEVTTWDGSKLMARNITARTNPDTPDRILLCAHWDSRPWADNDPDEANHHTPVLAANDGASGVAVMLELCRLLQTQPLSVGVDMVCFDAEDMGTPQWAEAETYESATWCLGSAAWAQAALEAGYQARYGVLLDMVGGRGTTFSREQHSMRFAQPIVSVFWQLAGQLGYRPFFPLTDGGYVTDDHVNVNAIAGIPCIDIIPYCQDGPSSFGPTWHTIHDTPDNIDPNVLEAVGQTLTQLIYNEQ